jgi:uncharacterized DUF497 family protein
MHIPVTCDPWKAAHNKRKHRVSFEEAVTALRDEHGATFPDPHHSRGETRLIHVGMSARCRVLVVIYMERGDTLRIISSRVATPTERRSYKEG